MNGHISIVCAGLLTEALEQLEYSYELTNEHESWLVRDSEDETLHNDACINLHRVYTKMAISALEDGDADASVNCYLKAYNAAREGGWNIIKINNKTTIYKAQ